MPTLFRRASYQTVAVTIVHAALVFGAVSGCATLRAGRGMNVSSEIGDYSPTIRLAVAALSPARIDDSMATVVIRVDSGVVTAPGEFTPGMPVAMRALQIRALLAEFRPATARHDSLIAPWRETGQSAAQPLADSLRLGEHATVGRMDFPISVSRTQLATANGLVFEITGAAISTPVRLATGELVRGAPRSNIRVFACSTFRLDGRVDRTRAKALRTNYTSGC